MSENIEEKVDDEELSSLENKAMVGDPLIGGFDLGIRLMGVMALTVLPYAKTSKICWTLLKSDKFNFYHGAYVVGSALNDVGRLFLYANLLS